MALAVPPLLASYHSATYAARGALWHYLLRAGQRQRAVDGLTARAVDGLTARRTG